MTAFSGQNMSFTKKAHIAAQTQFYPQMWPGCRLNFIDTTQAVQDLEYAIDVIAEVSLPDPDARGPIKFYIQERWRRPANKKYRDITITEWNLQTNQPSELHKLAAQLFVYGYYDDTTNRITDAVAVDVCRMQHANARGQLKYQRQKRAGRDQSFIGVDMDHLADISAVIHNLNTKVETLTDLAQQRRWSKAASEMWGV